MKQYKIRTILLASLLLTSINSFAYTIDYSKSDKINLDNLDNVNNHIKTYYQNGKLVFEYNKKERLSINHYLKPVFLTIEWYDKKTNKIIKEKSIEIKPKNNIYTDKIKTKPDGEYYYKAYINDLEINTGNKIGVSKIAKVLSENEYKKYKEQLKKKQKEIKVPKITDDELLLLGVSEEEQEKARKLAEEKAKAEELTRIKAEQEKARKLAEEKAKAEELARIKAEQEKARKLAEEKAKAEELARIKAEQEKARKLAEEKAKAEELARIKAEQEKARKLAEEKAKAEELARIKAEQEKARAFADKKIKEFDEMRRQERLAATKVNTKIEMEEIKVKPKPIIVEEIKLSDEIKIIPNVKNKFNKEEIKIKPKPIIVEEIEFKTEITKVPSIKDKLKKENLKIIPDVIIVEEIDIKNKNQNIPTKKTEITKVKKENPEQKIQIIELNKKENKVSEIIKPTYENKKIKEEEKPSEIIEFEVEIEN